MNRTIAPLPVLAALTALAGCSAEPEPPAPQPTPARSAAPNSILRADVEQPEARADSAALEPLTLTIGFPDGGAELSQDALEQLGGLLASPQIEAGGAIVLRGHSDASGSDTANLRAGEARNEAVRGWLVENGIAPGRITAISFGEQNPLRPNATPDGSPDEAGRAANRRVEVEVVAPPVESAEAEVPADTAS